MVAYACNLKTQEVEAGESKVQNYHLQGQSQFGLHEILYQNNNNLNNECNMHANPALRNLGQKNQEF